MKSSKTHSRVEIANPRHCPLCGEPNACAMAEGSTEVCWCVSATIPEWLRARVPDEVEGRCICRSCVCDATKARSDT